MRLTTSTLLSLPALAGAICHHGTSFWPRSSDGEVTVATFGYEGTDGPVGWAAMDEDYEVCATGTRQSPVNLVESDAITKISGADIHLDLPALPEGAELENLGATLEVVLDDAGASIEYAGKNASLKQYHFHVPSEHHWDGEFEVMEAHFVFQAEDSSIIVLGLPLTLCSKSTPVISATFAHLPDVASPGTKSHTGALDFAPLARHVARSPAYTYAGSLTTPPCSEVVTWLVVEQPLAVSVQTFKTVKKILGFNSRYTQGEPGEVNLLEYVAEEVFGAAGN